MLVNFVVVLVVSLSDFIGVLGLLKITLELVQNSNFEVGVYSALHWEIAGQDRGLEVPHCLIELVGFGQNDT